MNSILSLWTQRALPSFTGFDQHPKRVLVVEDELALGALAAEAVEEAGYAVLTAASAEEAEVILSHEPVDVLFSDIDLGGRDGCDLATLARAIQPHIAVILTSGRPRSHVSRIPGHAAFLPKPYRLYAMVDEIHRAALQAA